MTILETSEGSFMEKDVFYRLKNSPFICWRMIMWHLMYLFLKVTSQDRDVDGCCLFRYTGMVNPLLECHCFCLFFADGETIIEDACQIERGYEQIEVKL